MPKNPILRALGRTFGRLILRARRQGVQICCERWTQRETVGLRAILVYSNVCLRTFGRRNIARRNLPGRIRKPH